MRIDMTQVAELASDMHGVSARVTPKVRKVMSKGALNVKTGMQNDLRSGSRGGGTHSRVAADVSYDFTDGLRVEVGPTLGDSGSLMLLYYGNSKAGPTTADPIRVMRKESPNLARHVLGAGAESVW